MINLYISSNNFSSDDKMCQNLDEGRHIFVVPDRYALTQENNLFDFCKKDSFVNVDVLTLSRLGKMLCAYDNTITRTGSIMLITKILKDNIDKFVCFNKADINVEFAENIYDTINQFKTCQISIEQVRQVNTDKMQDLALIYQCYQKELSGKIDSADRISLLVDKIEETDFSDTDFYFLHFDSFTYQAYRVIEELSQRAKSVSLAINYATNRPNEHIYSKDILNAISLIARRHKQTLNVNYVDSVCKGDFEKLEKNLYSYKNTKLLNCNQIHIYECTDVRSEITKVCVAITKLLRNGYHYQDICVLMPDIVSKKNLIDEIFDRYDIDYYADIDYNINQTLIYKFLFDIVKFLNSDRAIDYIALAKNPILEYDENYVIEYIKDCNKYVLNGKRLLEFDGQEAFNVINNGLKEIKKELNNILSQCNTVGQYIEFVRYIIKKFDLVKKVDNIVDVFGQEKDLLNERIYRQIMPLLDELLVEMDNILSTKQMAFDDFVELLRFGIESIKVSTVPIAIDNVFVGDVSKSMVYRPKVMIICDCNEGAVPNLKNDCGIITDGEIEQASSVFELKPTIKDINDRERLKVFNLCICPTDKLMLFYNLNGSPSTIVNQCANMGASVIKQEQYDEFLVEDMLSSTKNMSLTMTNLIRKHYDGINMPIDTFVPYINYLVDKQLIDMSVFNCKNNPTVTGIDMLSASASDIETYYSCPFMRFARYALNLEKDENIIIDYKDIGNILHNIAEVYIKDYKLCELTKPIEQEIIKKVFDKPEFAQLKKLPLNVHTLDNLIVESKKLLATLYYQNKHSKFVNILCEAKLNKDINSLKLDIDGKKILISGKIDRIDQYGDYIRIIDYKTGSIESIGKGLYYGKKIQLHLYGYVASISLNKKISGLYYFPIKLDNGKAGYGAYQLKGITLSNEDVVLASDNKLPKEQSDIIKVKYNKDGSLSKSSELVDEKELNAQINYAIKMFKQAIKDIIKGNIIPSPLQDGGNLACNICPYKSICRFDTTLGNTQRTMSNFESSFMEVSDESK